jgi:hypothetical protein
MPLITEEYKNLLLEMRSPNHRPNWGNGGNPHVPRLVEFYTNRKNRKHIRSILDYGCGHGKILSKLSSSPGMDHIRYSGYDPGIPERSALPEPADLVVCTDVLEHIEPDCLDSVLQHLSELVIYAGYFMPHTGPANAILPDGRNAHLIQQPAEWWEKKIKEYFPVVERWGGSGHRPVFLCYQTTTQEPPSGGSSQSKQ